MDTDIQEAPVEAKQDAQPVEAPSSFDLLIGKIEARLTNLENVAHQGHNFTLDESAVDLIASRVWDKINANIKKHLE
jgi:hypothetical protein